MRTGRLEAFSDGVLAIVITIMVLELDVPETGSLDALLPVLPTFVAYVLSFLYVGIAWNNHHHLLALSRRRDATVLWANLHLLFWISLIPFASGWLGRAGLDSPGPAALYGTVLLMMGVAYSVLQHRILRAEPDDAPIAREIGRDLKGRASIGLYLAAIGLAFVAPLASVALYTAVALLWTVPDRRLERAWAAANDEEDRE